MRLIAPILSLVLLGAIFIEGLGHASPARAEPYHARVRELAERIPRQIGDWVGEDTPVPAQARDLLRPNVLVCRRYVAPDGEAATLLVVQSADARDMGGHYPPVCYPNSGWSEVDAPRHTDIRVGRLTIPVTEYAYGISGMDGSRERRILDFFVLKPVGPVRDQGFVRRQASDYRLRHYGAAQFQVIVDGSVPLSDRERIFAQLVEPLAPMIEAIHAPAGETP